MKPARAAVRALAGVALAACLAPPASAQSDAIELPEGFSATVFAEGVGRARHVAVRANGDVYVRLQQPVGRDGIVALRDGDGDGAAEDIEYFGETAGTGIAIRGDWLYVSSDERILRYRLPAEGLVPEGEPEEIVGGFPEQRAHAPKAIAFSGDGGLIVNVGAPSNACQPPRPAPRTPGQDPCPQLERQAGLWRFDPDRPGQTQADGERVGTGIRNVVALDASPQTGEIFFVQHGRDQLRDLWPGLYTDEQNAELPAEELHVLVAGTDYGWPYTYWDQLVGERMVAPEYGGDGRTPVAPGRHPDPLAAFPGHWAPNDLEFYEGDDFPEGWREGAFVAFHGSWGRAPLPQAGFYVVFVPFADGRPAGLWRIFAEGFTGSRRPVAPDQARHRPMGLAVAPDGALFIADSVRGTIWRVTAD